MHSLRCACAQVSLSVAYLVRATSDTAPDIVEGLGADRAAFGNRVAAQLLTVGVFADTATPSVRWAPGDLPCVALSSCFLGVDTHSTHTRPDVVVGAGWCIPPPPSSSHTRVCVHTLLHQRVP